MLLDLHVREQVYVEDCEVCCNPIELDVKASNGAVEDVEIRKPY